jgi:hypothetical protein
MATHVLNGDKVWLDEGKVVVLPGAKHADNARIVNSRDKNTKEVIEKPGLLSEIKGKDPSVKRLNQTSASTNMEKFVVSIMTMIVPCKETRTFRHLQL